MGYEEIKIMFNIFKSKVKEMVNIQWGGVEMAVMEKENYKVELRLFVYNTPKCERFISVGIHFRFGKYFLGHPMWIPVNENGYDSTAAWNRALILPNPNGVYGRFYSWEKATTVDAFTDLPIKIVEDYFKYAKVDKDEFLKQALESGEFDGDNLVWDDRIKES